MAIAEVKIVPVGTGDTSFSSIVSKAYRVVDESGLKHQLTPTSTVVEGDLDDLFELAKKMHQSSFKGGASRIITTISIDERRDKEMDMEDMVQTVATEVAKELSF